MSPETSILEADIVAILATYDCGHFSSFKTFAQGTTQTTVLVQTDKGKFVLRYFENRAASYVLFEVDLLQALIQAKYPVPEIIANSLGTMLGEYKGKPYVVSEYIDGVHVQNPNDFFDKGAVDEIVDAVARLHALTEGKESIYSGRREAFDSAYCLRQYQGRPTSEVQRARESWLKFELNRLEFPGALPKGVNHADLNHSNFLFKNRRVVAVLDLDMSFYGQLVYDLASLLYWWAWPPDQEFDWERARHILTTYSISRPLSVVEKRHIFDALKLIILLGVVWSPDDDYEQSKKNSDYMNSLGRAAFYQSIFGHEP